MNKVSIATKPLVYSTFRYIANTAWNALAEYVDNSLQSFQAHKEQLSQINDGGKVRVEIRIAPKDMGKIAIGQRVKYRLSAFPYFEYKGAEGIITSIDPDIRTTPEGDRAYYSVYADIDRTNFSNKHGEVFPIRAGLETDVRIVMERKPIIFYILKKLDFIN